MVTGDLDFKHFFIVRDGELIYDNKEMLSFFVKRLEGKRGYLIVREYEEEVTPNQWAFYFGGIIRSECMNSDCFIGLTDKQIHQVLFSELRSKEIIITLPDGSTRQKTITDDFKAYGKRKMARYMDDVIKHLQVDYNIHVKDPKMYAGYNKMLIRMKTLDNPKKENTNINLNEGW